VYLESAGSKAGDSVLNEIESRVMTRRLDAATINSFKELLVVWSALPAKHSAAVRSLRRGSRGSAFRGLQIITWRISSLEFEVNNNFKTILETLEDYINFASNSYCNQ
jgi:hypothetical protein